MTRKKGKVIDSGVIEIISILDRSGSMLDLEPETIGGYNNFISNQRNELVNARVTLVLFDDEYEVVHKGVPIDEVPDIDNKVYYARGYTALNDAIAKTINETKARHRRDGKPDKVLCVIITDGEENYSKEYSGLDGKEKVKKLVEWCKEEEDWTFFFLGADMDAVTVGAGYGIASAMVANYQSNDIGTHAVYATMSRGAAAMSSGSMSSFNLQEEVDDETDKFTYQSGSRLP